jgi:hypothetical protein
MGCADVDECVIPGQSNCHADADCINQEGGYACQCRLGLIGNGRNCDCKQKRDIFNKAFLFYLRRSSPQVKYWVKLLLFFFFSSTLLIFTTVRDNELKFFIQPPYSNKKYLQVLPGVTNCDQV